MALTYDGANLDFRAFLKREAGHSRLDLLVQDARCAGCMGKIEREMLPGPVSRRRG